MDNGPSEVVFTTTSSPIESGVVFRYGQGSVKVPAPRKRGRPIGCKQLVLYTRTTKLDADLFNQQLREEKLEMMWMSRNGKIMKDFNLSIWVVIRPTSIVIPGDILERGWCSTTHTPTRSANSSPLNVQKKRQAPRQDFPQKWCPRNLAVWTPSTRYRFNLSHICMIYSPCVGLLFLVLLKICNSWPLLKDITTIWETLYSIEKRSGCNPMVNYWLPLAFNDPAFLHSLIGCAASFLVTANQLCGYPFFVKHLNEAIAIVNQRMADSTISVSDETLVVVASIAMIKVCCRNVQILGFTLLLTSK